MNYEPASQIGQTDRHTGKEETVASIDASVVHNVTMAARSLVHQNDGHNHTVNGYGLAENNTEVQKSETM